MTLLEAVEQANFTPGIKKKVLKNIKRAGTGDETLSSFSDLNMNDTFEQRIIHQGFIWSDSEEGINYWMNVNSKLK